MVFVPPRALPHSDRTTEMEETNTEGGQAGEGVPDAPGARELSDVPPRGSVNGGGDGCRKCRREGIFGKQVVQGRHRMLARLAEPLMLETRVGAVVLLLAAA